MFFVFSYVRIVQFTNIYLYLDRYGKNIKMDKIEYL